MVPAWIWTLWVASCLLVVQGFVLHPHAGLSTTTQSNTACRMIPPGSSPHHPTNLEKSGVESNAYPDYEPLQGYTGTCKPGTTPENAPFSELDMSMRIPEPQLRELPFHRINEIAHKAPEGLMEFVQRLGRWDNEDFEATARKRYEALQAGEDEDDREEDIDDDELLDDDEFEIEAFSSTPSGMVG